jgi:hypothetical protein
MSEPDNLFSNGTSQLPLFRYGRLEAPPNRLKAKNELRPECTLFALQRKPDRHAKRTGSHLSEVEASQRGLTAILAPRLRRINSETLVWPVHQFGLWHKLHNLGADNSSV